MLNGKMRVRVAEQEKTGLKKSHGLCEQQKKHSGMPRVCEGSSRIKLGDKAEAFD